MSGVRTPNLTLSNRIDEIVGNQIIGDVPRTRRVPLADLKTQLQLTERVLNILDYIPEDLHPDILDHTSTDDVTEWMIEARDDAYVRRARVYMPAGRYNLIESGVAPASRVIFEGDGRDLTVIVVHNEFGGFAQEDGTQFVHGGIIGMTFEAAEGNEDAIPLIFKCIQGSTIRNIGFRGFSAGVPMWIHSVVVTEFDDDQEPWSNSNSIFNTFEDWISDSCLEPLRLEGLYGSTPTVSPADSSPTPLAVVTQNLYQNMRFWNCANGPRIIKCCDSEDFSSILVRLLAGGNFWTFGDPEYRGNNYVNSHRIDCTLSKGAGGTVTFFNAESWTFGHSIKIQHDVPLADIDLITDANGTDGVFGYEIEAQNGFEDSPSLLDNTTIIEESRRKFYRAGSGSAEVPTYGFGDNRNSGVFLNATDQVGVAAGGVTAALFKTSGVEFPSGKTAVLGRDPTADLDAVSRQYLHLFHGGSPLVYLITGQSNAEIETAFSWSPSDRLQILNNASQVEASVGTAFEALDGTWINAAVKLASEIADRQGREVRIIKAGWGGMNISQWIFGLKHDWSTNTSVSDPGAGNIKGNNVALASVTKISISHTDRNGINRNQTLLSLISGHYLELRNDADEVVRKYSVTGVTPHAGWTEVDVTLTSGSGSFSGGDNVRTLGPPNMQLVLDNNVTAGLALLGKDKIDGVIWVQGAADAAAPTHQVEDFEEMHLLLQEYDWYDEETPWIVSGESGSAQTGDPNFGIINNYLQRIVANRPDTRTFVYPAIFPIEFWDAGASYFHMTGEGYSRAGRMFYENVFEGTGRKIQQGIVVDPETGNMGLFDVPESDVTLRRDLDRIVEHLSRNDHIGSSAAIRHRLQTDCGLLDTFAQSLALGGFAGWSWSGDNWLTLTSLVSKFRMAGQGSSFGLDVGSAGAEVPQGMKLNFRDLTSDHMLRVKFLQELTGDRDLTLEVDDASRVLSVLGNAKVDQDLRAAASPLFANSVLIPIQHSVDFNVGNTDTAFAVPLPIGFTRYQINAVIISEASGALTTATFGVFTAVAGGGFAPVASGTACTVSTASETTNNNMQVCTIVQGLTESINAGTLYFRVQTPQGAPATAKVSIFVRPVS